MPLTKFTSDQLQELKVDFKELVTIEEKYRFWKDRLKHRYMWVGVNVPTNDVLDFLITPKTSEETIELNLLLLEEIETFYSVSFRNPLLYSESLKKGLNERLEGVVKPLPILQDALEWIDVEVKKMIKKSSKDGQESDLYKPSVSPMWLWAYDAQYLKGHEVEISHVPSDMLSIIGAHNGSEVAKYRVYVEELIEKVNNKQTLPLREETPLKRQLLLLEYTGMLDTLNQLQQQEKHKLLSVLLNVSENSIKQDLTNLPKRSHTYRIRTESNYSFLLNLFSEVGLSKQAEEVKNELDKLRQERK